MRLLTLALVLLLAGCTGSGLVDHAAPAPGGSLPEDNPQIRVLVGMFSYMADAATFTECRTRQRLPVEMSGDYLALERAYLDTRRSPGEPVLVSVEGAIRMRPPMEGDTQVRTLVVNRFAGIWPGETCAR